MARTRVYVTDRAGNRLAQVASGRVGRLGLDLVRPHSVTLSADPSDLSELEVVDRELQVWIDDEASPRFVGVPFTASRGLNARRVSIPVMSIDAYLGRWHVDEDLTYAAVDQLSIGAQVIAWAQARMIDGADANIDAATFAPSGVARDRTYHADELPNVYEILDSFRGLANGFDWSIEPDGPDRREWTPYYPRRGIFRDAWHLAYRDGRPGNLAAIGYNVDGSQTTRRHHSTSHGTGDGPDKLVGTYTDPAIPAGAVLLESVSAASTSITDVATLEAAAQGRVEARRAAVTTWEALVTDPTIAMGIGLGDTVPVDLDDGWRSYRGIARVLAISLDPVSERATLTLTEEGA